MKLLFICKKRLIYGQNINVTSFGLINSARLVCFVLSKLGIECKTIMVDDSNDIDREVTAYKPSHVILEALWTTPTKMVEIVKRHTDIKWYIRIHSKLSFLAYEGIAIEWIHEITKNRFLRNHVTIASNSKETCRELEHLLKTKVEYMPNLYYVNWKSYDHETEEGVINIGCFGSIRPLKNTLIQAVAAIKFADDLEIKLKFHVNGKTEQHADGVLRNLRSLFHHHPRHELIEHPWYTHSEFQRVVRGMDIGMQVSFSETFNIVTADFVNNGVPVVVSDEIDYVPFYAQADTHTAHSITKTLHTVWKLRFLCETFINKIYLYFYNDSAKKIWLRLLS